MRKALFFVGLVGWSALLACGSNLTSAPEGGADTGQGDGTIVVEAHAPDAGHDAHPPPPDAMTDGKPGDVTVDGHTRDGATEGGSAEGGREAATEAAVDGEGALDAPADATFDAMEETAAADVVVPPSDGSTCLAETPNASTGLFVVQGGSTSGSCGTLTDPCGGLDVAVGVASMSPSVTTIYVGPGTFTSSMPIALPRGLAVIGGWKVVKTTWTHDCSPPTIEGPSPVFSATSLVSPATLDTLDVVETAIAKAGESIYGITSLDSTLILTNVSITVNGGGAGAKGATVGAAGKAGGSNGCKPAGDGGPGVPGDAGAPTSGGAFGPPPGCFTAASDGTTGLTGGSGEHGTPGTHGQGGKNYNCTLSGGTCMTVSTDEVDAGTGLGGCGGAGGKGGSPGSGGGCSIGLYVWGGSVTFTGGTVTTGPGGAGGDGVGGGDGGPGAAGVGTKSITYNTACVTIPVPGPHCSSATTATLLGGDAGGPGGPGATGGQGGGGAGGCSYAYYVGGDGGTVAPTGVTLLPGAGGPGGAPNGVAGPSGDHN